ncbi:MAG: 50S ribosomal protein L23 [Clostridia bacterium]|jgi:large subunit ribosomal protein L23|nr:50S ribosomal protein L23 [Clostridia bacterium]MBQ7592283.1 50S ribosomal protein L23 [Clostridia bacterium]
MEKMIQDIIISPIITESSMDMMQNKKYVFKVMRSATKPEIAEAVEKMFDVKVKSVNTLNVKGKQRRVRYQQGYTAAWKKAFVTLTEDSKTIAFFDGLN